MTQAEADAYGNVDYSSAKYDESYEDIWFFYDCLYEITNTPTFVMPLTGGNGIWKYSLLGMCVMASIAAWFVFRNKTVKKHRHFKI